MVATQVPSHEEQVRALIGLRTRDIVKQTGMAPTTVRFYRKRILGSAAVPITFWTPEKTQSLKDLWDFRPEMSAARIAEELHTNRNAVLGKVWRLHLPHRKPSGPRPANPARPSRPRIPRQQLAPSMPSPAVPDVLLGPPVSFAELQPHHCRYPLGEVSSNTTISYCGAQRLEKAPVNIGSSYSPYCAHHAEICYRSS